LLKDHPVWLDGRAVAAAIHVEAYALPISHWLRHWVGATVPVTYFVYYLELLSPLFLFSPVWHVPLRVVGLAMLVAMHIGFALFLGIGLFPLISIASLVLFIP